MKANLIPAPTLLLILFIGLRLTNHIAWSWWWVLAPGWMPVALGLLIAGLALLMHVLFGSGGGKKR